MWLSPVVLGGFLLSVLIHCMCGPFCGTTGFSEHIPAVQSSCCSSHAPVPTAPVTPGCCKPGQGAAQCEDAVLEKALQVSDSSVPLAVPAAVVIDIILPKAADLPVRRDRAALSMAARRPPAYMQFQSYLI
ncbi:hypothetical protein [Pontiella sp.]|uniref:hypothetical protein n=1 Tax=Pontiella sp. TaxID=2837462 RepID=UPI00356A3B9F